MKGFKFKLFFVALFVLAMPLFAEAEADAIIGEWYTEGNKSVVQIYKCQEKFCGKIIWLKEPLNDKGQEKRDGENPDPNLQQRKIVGMDLVSGFVYDGDNIWREGVIYNPENGKTYSCKMTLKGKELHVRGYIMGMTFLGETTVWAKK